MRKLYGHSTPRRAVNHRSARIIRSPPRLLVSPTKQTSFDVVQGSFFRPAGALSFCIFTHGLRRGLCSDAASRLGRPLAGADARPIAAVMKKYEGMRPQLADAALVYLADRDGIDTIFTLDQRDFTVYRSARKRPFRIVPEA